MEATGAAAPTEDQVLPTSAPAPAPASEPASEPASAPALVAASEPAPDTPTKCDVVPSVSDAVASQGVTEVHIEDGASDADAAARAAQSLGAVKRSWADEVDAVDPSDGPSHEATAHTATPPWLVDAQDKLSERETDAAHAPVPTERAPIDVELARIAERLASVERILFRLADALHASNAKRARRDDATDAGAYAYSVPPTPQRRIVRNAFDIERTRSNRR